MSMDKRTSITIIVFTLLVLISLANLINEASIVSKPYRYYGIFPLLNTFVAPQNFGISISFWFMFSTFFGAYMAAKAIDGLIYRDNAKRTAGAALLAIALLAGSTVMMGYTSVYGMLYIASFLVAAVGLALVKNEDVKIEKNMLIRNLDALMVAAYILLIFWFFFFITTVY